jgi:glycerol-3-phosphate acyltransferase PlsY
MYAVALPVAVIYLPIAYLLGSIPFGYLIVKLREGRDVRTAGSGNIGATNVGRVAGKAAGILTLLLDMAKGFAAVWLIGRLTQQHEGTMVVAGLVAVVGHMFPVWLKFRGGKGVATAVGAFVLINWQAVAGALVIWIVVVGIWRYVSLGSIIASASLPLFLYRFYAPPDAPPLSVSLSAVTVAVLIIFQHRDNIGRLVAGKEYRLKFK